MRLGYINTKTKYVPAEEQRQTISVFSEHQNVKIDAFLLDTDLSVNYLSRIGEQTTLIVKNVAVLGDGFENIIKTVQIYLNLNLSIYLIDEDIRLDSKKEFDFYTSSDVCLKIFKSILSIKNRGVVATIRASGRRAGRQFNSVNKKHKLDGKEKEIFSYLKEGLSQNKVSKIVGVSSSCLSRFIRKQELNVKW